MNQAKNLISKIQKSEGSSSLDPQTGVTFTTENNKAAIVRNNRYNEDQILPTQVNKEKLNRYLSFNRDEPKVNTTTAADIMIRVFP